ncbi:MAG: pilus assembly protein TadG-related protein [Bryobacteraceae bacterium]
MLEYGRAESKNSERSASLHKRNKESGQAAVLVVLASGLFIFGAVGLAIDGSHLYAERQMAHAAADTAAMAGTRSLSTGSNSMSGNSAGFATTGFTWTTTDGRTPCFYARTNGFGPSAADTVSVDFPVPPPSEFLWRCSRASILSTGCFGYERKHWDYDPRWTAAKRPDQFQRDKPFRRHLARRAPGMSISRRQARAGPAVNGITLADLHRIRAVCC